MKCDCPRDSPAIRLCGTGAMGRPGLFPIGRGDVAQLGERRLCKAEVVGSIPIVSTNFALARDVFLEWACSSVG